MVRLNPPPDVQNAIAFLRQAWEAWQPVPLAIDSPEWHARPVPEAVVCKALEPDVLVMGPEDYSFYGSSLVEVGLVICLLYVVYRIWRGLSRTEKRRAT